jgi:hypothetical protein
MIDPNSIHPISLYKRMADNLEENMNKDFERLDTLFDEAQEKLSKHDFHSWLCFAYGAFIACVTGLGTLDNLEKILEERMICPDCNGTGYVGIDTGGGNSRTTFCACPKGQELAEADEKARDSKVYDS